MEDKLTNTTIYVFLLDEGTEVWRPVDATCIKGNIYQIKSKTIIPEDETWEFLPGDIVRCEEKQLSKGNSIVAVEKVEFSDQG